MDSVTRSLQRVLPSKHSRRAPTLARSLIAAHPKRYTPTPKAVAGTLSGLPQIRKVWEYAHKHQAWPELSVEPCDFRPLAPFADLGLPALASSLELADWLAISPDQLIRFADRNSLSNRTDNAFAPHYLFHRIPKRNGAIRLIEEPKPFLKSLQRRLLSGMLNKVPPSSSAYGFTIGRDCLAAAQQHCGEEMLVSFDLRSFFPSVSHSRIFGLFRSLGYPDPVAADLVGLTTMSTPGHALGCLPPRERGLMIARHLPQGAPTSPCLANLCAYSLDRRLGGLARRLDASYTRYADDMTFSGDRSIAAILLKAVPDIVSEEGFRLNTQKTRHASSGQRQGTTGLIVNQHLNLRREDYDILKATLHHLETTNDPRRGDRAFLNSLSGKITWLERVNPAKGYKLRSRFNDILSA